jgi:P-type conjugative transfer protein TrbJ
MGQSGGLCYASPGAAQQFEADFSGAAPPPANAAQHMQQLAALTLGTLGGALGQQQASHFQYEDQQLANLESKNVGVSGRLQAIQVTNEILLAQAQQLQLIRQLLITLTNTEAVFHGARLSSDVQGVMETSQFLNAEGNAP